MPKDKVEHLSIFKGGKKFGTDSNGASGGLVIFWHNNWIYGNLIYHSRNLMNVHFVNSKDNFS